MTIRRRLALATVASSVVLAMAAPASAGSGATTRYVDDDGRAGPTSCGGNGRSYGTIQAAVDASDRNDVVIVCPGTYVGQVLIEGDRDGLTIKATGQWTASLRAPKSPDIEHSQPALVIVDGVDDVTIQHLQLLFPTTGSCVGFPNGIRASDADGLRLMGDHLRPIGGPSSTCGYAVGVSIDDSEGVRVSSVLVRDFLSAGITVYNSSGRIHESSVRYFHDGRTDAEASYGIRLASSVVTISDTVVRARGNGTDEDLSSIEVGIQIEGSTAGTLVRDTRVWGTSFGIVHYGDGPVLIRDNRVAITRQGIQVYSGGNRIVRNVISDATEYACYDSTTGSGTVGTDNDWADNVGFASYPTGICSPV